MRLLEKASVVLALFGLAGKALLFDGGDLLLIIALGTLATLYLLGSFALLNGVRLRQVFRAAALQVFSVRRVLGALGSGLALATVAIGVLFKLESWPDADVLLPPGVLLLAGAAAVVIGRHRRSPTAFSRAAIPRLVPALVGGLLLWLTPAPALFAFFHRQHPALVQAYRAYSAHPSAATHTALQREWGRVRGAVVQP